MSTNNEIQIDKLCQLPIASSQFMKWEEWLSNIHSVKDAYAEFRLIANDLFSHFYIKRGISDIEYRFLEVEFYFNSPDHIDGKKDTDNLFAYERCNAKTGEFLLHSSGVDICFEGTVLNPRNVKKWGAGDSSIVGGGILIRSLLRKESGKTDTIVAGPFDCADVLFNYTRIDTMPVLCYTNKPFISKSDCDDRITMANRCNARDANAIFESEQYCFYDSAYVNDYKWTDLSKQPLERYHPRYRKSYKNSYDKKPWKYSNQIVDNQ